MNVNFFIYLTNISLNFLTIFPMILPISLIYFYAKIVTGGDSAHAFIRYAILVSCLFFLSFIFLPSKDIFIFQLDRVACHEFSDNQEDMLAWYEFVGRLK